MPYKWNAKTNKFEFVNEEANTNIGGNGGGYPEKYPDKGVNAEYKYELDPNKGFVYVKRPEAETDAILEKDMELESYTPPAPKKEPFKFDLSKLLSFANPEVVKPGFVDNGIHGGYNYPSPIVQMQPTGGISGINQNDILNNTEGSTADKVNNYSAYMTDAIKNMNIATDEQKGLGSAGDFAKTLGGNVLMGGVDILQAANQIPRKGYEGLSYALDNVITDYNKDKDPIKGMYDKVNAYYNSLNEGIQNSLPQGTVASNVIGGAARSLPMMMLTGAAGNALIPGASEALNLGQKVQRMVPFGIGAGAGYVKAAEEEGATYPQQLLYGLIGGAAEMGTELIPMEAMGDVIFNSKLMNAGANALTGKYGKVAGKALLGMIGEGIQEAVVDPITGVAKKAIYKPDMKVYGPGGIIDTTQMEQDAWGGVAMSVMMMALGLGATSVSRKMAEAAIDKAAKGEKVTAKEISDIEKGTLKEVKLLNAPGAEVNASWSHDGKSEDVTVVDSFKRDGKFYFQDIFGRAIPGSEMKFIGEGAPNLRGTQDDKVVQPEVKAETEEEIQDKIVNGPDSEYTDTQKSIINYLKVPDTSLDELKTEAQATIDKLVDEEYQYLNNSKSKGVDQGTLIKDKEGAVIARLGRTSKNEQWYRDLYKELKHTPTKADLIEYAKRTLTEGYRDVGAEVGPNAKYLEAVQTLKDIGIIENNVKNGKLKIFSKATAPITLDERAVQVQDILNKRPAFDNEKAGKNNLTTLMKSIFSLKGNNNLKALSNMYASVENLKKNNLVSAETYKWFSNFLKAKGEQMKLQGEVKSATSSKEEVKSDGKQESNKSEGEKVAKTGEGNKSDNNRTDKKQETKRAGAIHTKGEIDKAFKEGIEDTKKWTGKEVKGKLSTKITKEQQNVEKFMRHFNIDVVFYESDSDFENEFTRNDSGIIFIKSKNTVQDSTFYAGHGFLHLLRTNHVNLYNELLNVVGNSITDKQIEAYKDSFTSLDYRDSMTRDKVVEEMLADEAGNMFTKAGFWEKVYSYSKKLFNDIVKIARSLMKGFSHENEFVSGLTSEQTIAFEEKFERIISQVMNGESSQGNMSDIYGKVDNMFSAREKGRTGEAVDLTLYKRIGDTKVEFDNQHDAGFFNFIKEHIDDEVFKEMQPLYDAMLEQIPYKAKSYKMPNLVEWVEGQNTDGISEEKQAYADAVKIKDKKVIDFKSKAENENEEINNYVIPRGLDTVLNKKKRNLIGQSFKNRLSESDDYKEGYSKAVDEWVKLPTPQSFIKMNRMLEKEMVDYGYYVDEMFPDNTSYSATARERKSTSNKTQDSGHTNTEVMRMADYKGELSILSENGFTMPYRRNLEASANMGSEFAQDIEPSGEYMNYHETKWGTSLPNTEYGSITFKKPLILEWETTRQGGWKTKLSEMYGGKVKNALTKAIVKDGYDSIVTIDSKTNEFQEIVNLSGNKGNGTDYSSREKQRKADTTTEEFKAWFGGSKVRDSSGKPLAVFHGTDNDFTEFKTSNMWGYGGTYFSTNKDVAKAYTFKDEIVSAYVSLQNPFIVEAHGTRYDVINRPKEMKGTGKVDTQEIVAFARDNKYDGVIVKDVIENGGIGDDIIAFNPNQIKSVYNNGTWDSNNNDINYSARNRQRKGTAGKVLFDETILDTSDTWKDKLKPALKLQTMKRNWIDIAGEKEGRRLYEALEEPIHKGEANRMRFLNKLRDEVKGFKVKWNTTEASAMQKYGEGQWVETDKDGKTTVHPYTLTDLQKDFPKRWQSIQAGAEYMKKTYEELFNQGNAVLTSLGFDPIPHRTGYFPHMADYDFLEKTFGLQNFQLPTDINGRTAMFKPNKPWFRSFLKRTGISTEYDAIRGFDDYVEGISKVIYQTENIKRLRQFENAIREKYGSNVSTNNPFGGEGDKHTHLSNFVSELQDYTNILAGKKSELDRSMEAFFDRWIYRGFDAVRRQTAANQVGGNIASAMTNFIPLTQAMATTRKDSFIKGLISTMGASFHDDGFSAGSDFITRRQGSDRLVENWWQKTGRLANVMFGMVDNFTSNVIVRAKYDEYLNHDKMTPEEAMRKADEWAASIIGDRSAGATPTVFASKLLAMTGFTQFQLEVNNQFSFFFKDIPQDKKHKLGSVLWSYFQIMVYGWLFNNLYEKLVGRRPAFDPVDLFHKTYVDWNNPDKDKLKVAANFADRFKDQLPFVSVLTGGRIPMGAGVPSIMSAINGETTWETELTKPLWYMLLPTGGGQLKKTIEGNKAVNDKGVYTNKDKDKLKYPVAETPWNRFTGTLFGKSALPETQDYYNNERAALSEAQTEEYNKLTKKGKLPESVYKGIYDEKEVNSAAYEARDIISGAVKDKKLTDSKADYLRNQISIILKSKYNKDTKINKIKDIQNKYFSN